LDIISKISGRRIYLDTNIWIYAFEGFPNYSAHIEEIFKIIDSGLSIAVSSELTLAEILIKPFMDDNIILQSLYRKTFKKSEKLDLIPINQEILIESARISANYRIKLPDAIHIASAILSECSIFITNDNQFKKLPDLELILLSEM
jgi:predicted nucleic acid-binding protein